MPWQFLSVLPNLELQETIEAREAAIVPPADERVLALRRENPNVESFLGRFRTTHGQVVNPAVVLRDANASPAKGTWEAMVGLRNCLSVSTVVHQTALVLLYPGQPRILFSDPFDFYPWSLDRNYEHMLSITPAIWAIHQVEQFAGQAAPGSPVHRLRLFDTDRPLLSELLARWDLAHGRRRISDFDRALFRSLNMANAAMAMPAVQGITIFDYGRQCALWISAFEILAHFHAGRGKADLPAVLQLLDKKPYLLRSLRQHRFTIVQRGRNSRVQLPLKLYALLYQVRNAFLHGNPVGAADLKLSWSGRPIFHFAPLLYRCALRNFLDLRFVPENPPRDRQARLQAQMDEHFYEAAQADVEQALGLAISRPQADE